MEILPILLKHRHYLSSIKDDIPDIYEEIVHYTKHNDKFLRVMNFIRNPSPKTFKSVLQLFKDVNEIKEYVDSINRVILNAPRSTIPITVYRGTGDVELSITKGTFKMKGFSGASLKPEVAAKFAESEECCLHELILPPGTPFLFIGYVSSVLSEYEILLPLECKFGFVRDDRINIDGVSYKIKMGRYINSKNFDDIDISKRSELDVRTLIYIKTSIEQLMNTHKKIYTIMKCNENPQSDKCIEMLKQNEIDKNEMIKKFANDFAVPIEKIKEKIGGKKTKKLSSIHKRRVTAHKR